MRLKHQWWSVLVAAVLSGLVGVMAVAAGEQFLPVLGVREGGQRFISHSTQFSGGACHHSSKASRREDLQVEEPVTCRDFSSFNFHPTLRGMLGATLVGHQVVQMGQPV